MGLLFWERVAFRLVCDRGKFAFDLTEKARVGQVDPVIGRESEVERCVQVLARRSKNNPILLGEPGVGKTAIAEGLAQRIVKGDVPEFLLEKRVCSLDIGLIMAGAKERGELEQRVKDILQECANNDDVILVRHVLCCLPSNLLFEIS